MKKDIPARQVVVCDSCGLECHMSFGPGRRRAGGEVGFQMDGLDQLGDPCARVKEVYDFCDDCMNQMVKLIQSQLHKTK